MKEVPALDVELTHREVIAANAELGRKSALSPTLYLLVMALVFIGAMETGLSLAFMISQNIALPWMVLVHQLLSTALPALLFLFGLWAVNNTYNRIAAERSARTVSALGTPDSVAATFTVEDAGFRLSTPRGEWLAMWISINRVIQTSDGWVVANDLGSLFVPRRSFADTDQERAWVKAILVRIPAAARTASEGARRFGDIPG